MLSANHILIFLLGLVLVHEAQAFFITIDAHAEECFFEKVTKGTKVGISFEVAEGGFLDIDVRIINPDGSVMQKGERESNGRYTFAAQMDGSYTYCFSNKMSTMTPKIVVFNVEVADPITEPHKTVGEHGEAQATDDGSDLETKIKELSAGLLGIKHEQDYMTIRDRNHRAINDDTNSKVVMWSFFEALVLVSMTAGQVYYLKQFFEVRRVV